jgi:hypothetical protein
MKCSATSSSGPKRRPCASGGNAQQDLPLIDLVGKEDAHAHGKEDEDGE